MVNYNGSNRSKVAVETITNFALVNVFEQDLETAEQYSKTAGQTRAMLEKPYYRPTKRYQHALSAHPSSTPVPQAPRHPEA